MFDDQIFWESRKKYCQILDLFVRKKISLDEFVTQFCGLRGSNNVEREFRRGILTQSNEIDVQLNPKSCGPDITLEMNFKWVRDKRRVFEIKNQRGFFSTTGEIF